VVFLSYRRDDTEGHAGHLGEWLVRRFGRDNVFRDVDSVLPGEDFVARITDAIRSCDVVLVLIGKSWLTTLDAAGQRRIDSPRDYVRLEIEAALANGVRTIPVLFQNANMPDEHELPETIATLARLQASVVAAGRWEHDVERLLNVIGGPITPDADARTSSDRSKPLAGTVLTKARGLKLVWICLAALAAAVLLGTIGFEADGYECGSPFSAKPFIADDPCISAIWTRRVIIILVVLAAGTGLVYGLTKKTKKANSEP
jgi:hypothetical protein